MDADDLFAGRNRRRELHFPAPAINIHDDRLSLMRTDVLDALSGTLDGLPANCQNAITALQACHSRRTAGRHVADYHIDITIIRNEVEEPGCLSLLGVRRWLDGQARPFPVA